MKQKPSDPLDGVKCFSIGGRMVETRQRCLGMTDEERRWRAQWLKDQILSPEEPRDVTAYYKHTTNIFRRIYKTPLYWLQKALRPKLGYENALIARHFVGKSSLFLTITFFTIYFFKYHTNDFTLSRTVEFAMSEKAMSIFDPNYPNFYVKQPFEYYDQGFYSSVLCQPVEPLPPPPPPPPPPAPPADLCGTNESENH